MIARNSGSATGVISRKTFPGSFGFIDSSSLTDKEAAALIQKYGDLIWTYPDGDMVVEPSSVVANGNEAFIEESSVSVMVDGVKKSHLGGINLALTKDASGRWLVSGEHEHEH
jgi:hypothetical protein